MRSSSPRASSCKGYVVTFAAVFFSWRERERPAQDEGTAYSMVMVKPLFIRQEIIDRPSYIHAHTHTQSSDRSSSCATPSAPSSWPAPQMLVSMPCSQLYYILPMWPAPTTSSNAPRCPSRCVDSFLLLFPFPPQKTSSIGAGVLSLDARVFWGGVEASKGTTYFMTPSHIRSSSSPRHPRAQIGFVLGVSVMITFLSLMTAVFWVRTQIGQARHHHTLPLGPQQLTVYTTEPPTIAR
jgi:hypothetical protein